MTGVVFERGLFCVEHWRGEWGQNMYSPRHRLILKYLPGQLARIRIGADSLEALHRCLSDIKALYPWVPLPETEDDITLLYTWLCSPHGRL